MVIAPPAIYLISVKESVRKEVQIAAQNCYFKESGAFTGEIRYFFTRVHDNFFFKVLTPKCSSLNSPKQLVDAGIPYVILGNHSS